MKCESCHKSRDIKILEIHGKNKVQIFLMLILWFTVV